MAPIPAGGEGVGGAIFFRKIENIGMGKMDSEGNGMGRVAARFACNCTESKKFCQQHFSKYFQNGTSSKSD